MLKHLLDKILTLISTLNIFYTDQLLCIGKIEH